jgi:hypothetical protein
MERYITVSAHEWELSLAAEGGLKAHDLLSLDEASKVANSTAARRQEPIYVVKLVPVSLHRTTTNVHVEQL